MAKEIFISYSRRDFDKVKAIKDEIDRELGIDCWMDLEGIESGQQFEDVIINAINDHDTMLFMLSPNSMDSEWALDELNFAKIKGKRIVLLYIVPCQMTDKFCFKYSKYDAIEWHNPLQHNKLINNLRTWFNVKQPPTPQGPTDAAEQYVLGCDYYIQQDYDQAVYWFTKAAEQGYPAAQFDLAICYANGTGVEKDERQAVYWYTKAAEQEHTTAQFNLGVCYANGIGIKQDFDQAVYWYRKAAEQGDATAQNNLGVCYEYGDGVKQDHKQAVYWYRKAADQGYAKAQCNLGYCYSLAVGVEKDNSLSFYWYSKAAEQGDSDAQCILGNWYDEGGDGVKRDLSKAIYWYRKSAEQGDEDAIKWLKEHNISI